MKLGVHVSIAGRIYEAIDRARELGCQTMQMFSRNPRGWAAAKLVPEDVEEFKKRRKASRITPLAVHIPYLINLGSPEKGLWKRSIQAYVEDIIRADKLGAEYFVTHLGSHKGKGPEQGIDRFAKGLNIAIQRSKPRLMILLENTAGQGDSMGHKFEQIKAIIDKTKNKKKLGICFDTCHAYAAGYDVATKKGLEQTLKQVDKTVGIKNIKLIHANDAKGPLGSHLDRHEHIGKGKIGLAGFKIFVNHPKLKDLPYILETPKKDPKWDPMNMAALRKLAK
jgi:deoxyribonuclease-4